MGKQKGLTKQREQLCPLSLPPSVTVLLPSSKHQEKPLCSQPVAAAAGDGSQRQLHGTGSEKPPGHSSRLAAVSFAPSPCSWLHASHTSAGWLGRCSCFPLCSGSSWPPRGEQHAGSVTVNIKRKPSISSSLIMLENQSGFFACGVFVCLFVSSTYLRLHGCFRSFHADDKGSAQPYF